LVATTDLVEFKLKPVAADASGRFIEREIYRVSRNGAKVKRLTDTAAREDDPVWSPDGRFIA
jgi:Tol biopolymer transport system component